MSSSPDRVELRVHGTSGLSRTGTKQKKYLHVGQVAENINCPHLQFFIYLFIFLLWISSSPV